MAIIAQIIAYHRASVIFLPHDQDQHSTHMGTHHLVVDALRSLGPGFRCKVVETEFWRPMADPNLMVESSPAEVADLVAAVSFHKGEVAPQPLPPGPALAGWPTTCAGAANWWGARARRPGPSISPPCTACGSGPRATSPRCLNARGSSPPARALAPLFKIRSKNPD